MCPYVTRMFSCGVLVKRDRLFFIRFLFSSMFNVNSRVFTADRPNDHEG